MADRERSRSRSPEGGAPPAEEPAQNGEDAAPADAPPAEGASAGDGAPAGDDATDEVKLYVGNLDYGTLRWCRLCLFVDILIQLDSL